MSAISRGDDPALVREHDGLHALAHAQLHEDAGHPGRRSASSCTRGRIEFRLGARKIVGGPGDVVVVPAGKVHAFKNVGGEEAKVRVQVTPALDMERLFEATVALAEEGATNRKGMPRPLHLALFVRRFRREVPVVAVTA